MIIGKQIEAGVSLEGVRGTTPVAVQQWIKKITCDVEVKSENVVDESTYGHLSDSQNRRVTKKWIEGALEGNIHIDPLGYYLKNIYGACVSTVIAATTVYEHVFTLDNDTKHESISLYLKDGDVNQLAFSNCMISDFEIKAEVDSFINFAATIVGKAEAADSNIPSYDEEYDFITKDAYVKVADTEAGLPGATAIKAKGFSVKWNMGALQDFVIGAYTPDDVYNTKMSIEGTLSLNYLDQTFRDMYQDDSAKYMEIVLEGAVDLDSGEHHKLTILLNKAQITEWTKSGAADEIVTEEVTFKAFYNESDSQQSKVITQSLTTAYEAV